MPLDFLHAGLLNLVNIAQYFLQMLLHVIFQKNKYLDSILLSTVVSPLVHQIRSSLYSLPHCQQESEIQSSTSLF